MAKKNSSKTATEKAIQASEPRVMTYRGWQGVNFVDAPLTWNPLEIGQNKFRQTDLPDNFFMVQNNLITTDTQAIETRYDSIPVGKLDDYSVFTQWNMDGTVEQITIDDYKESYNSIAFTGVSGIYKDYVFQVVRLSDPVSPSANPDMFIDMIVYHSLNISTSENTINHWYILNANVSGVQPLQVEICEIGFFEENIVATARDHKPTVPEGLLLLAKIKEQEDERPSLKFMGVDWFNNRAEVTNIICDTPKMMNRPSAVPVISVKGMKSWDPATHQGQTPPESTPVRVEVKFCYTNRLGSTLTHTDPMTTTMYVEYSPALWTTARYMIISPSVNENLLDVLSITGVDLYARDNENIDWVFIGHVDVNLSQVTSTSASARWKYNWYGNMTDITQWLTAQLMVPTDNTTHGPDATHFNCHDSRMYYWGMPSKPYRLWIGGNPGAEFSVARGLGGAWVDIEPGSGYDIKGTAKWKTVSGANIVTIMCGNNNTTKIKRFNLVETNLTLTNEVAYKSYMYEEVSNVVGCNSRWGYGVYTDGLYSLNRYGLMLTTMAMEYNSQMKNQKVSDVIEPIFTERLGKRLRDGRMVCINDVIYIALSEEAEDATEDPIGLDNVILCYDLNLKAWYTWTHDQTLNQEQDPDKILHIFAIDSDEFQEGLGSVTETEVRLYPVTGVQDATVPEFTVLVESGELAPRQPMQAFWYVQQLEFRFDYFVGNPDEPAEILVEGVDYYGRQFKITKKLNIKSRNWQVRNDNGETGERRSYVEWVRIDKLVESFRIRIKGKARFRLTHFNANVYQQSDTIGTPYGFDARDTYYDKNGDDHEIHHYIEDYNNLRRAVVS